MTMGLQSSPATISQDNKGTQTETQLAATSQSAAVVAAVAATPVPPARAMASFSTLPVELHKHILLELQQLYFLDFKTTRAAELKAALEDNPELSSDIKDWNDAHEFGLWEGYMGAKALKEYRLLSIVWNALIFHEFHGSKLFASLRFGPLDAERTLRVFRGQPVLQRCVHVWYFANGPRTLPLGTGIDDVAAIRDAIYAIWEELAQWSAADKNNNGGGITLMQLGAGGNSNSNAHQGAADRDKGGRRLVYLDRGPLPAVPAIKFVGVASTRLFESNRKGSIHLAPSTLARMFASFPNLRFDGGQDFRWPGPSGPNTVFVPLFAPGSPLRDEVFDGTLIRVPLYGNRDTTTCLDHC